MRACGYVGVYMHVCIVLWHDNPHPHRVVQFLSRCHNKDGGFAGDRGSWNIWHQPTPQYYHCVSLALRKPMTVLTGRCGRY